MKFRARMQITGINPYVRVSAARADKIKPRWRKPLPVLVRVNGEPRAKPWRINMMPMGNGDFYLYLHGDVRCASRSEVGDMIEVEVEHDASYRGGPARMPPWFRAALAANAQARAAFAALPPSRRKEIVRYLLALKTEPARARNLARALAALTRKGTRFMGRDW